MAARKKEPALVGVNAVKLTNVNSIFKDFNKNLILFLIL